MNKNEMPKYIGRDTLTVAECMQKIDANTSGILFLVDRDDRLTGCITDGDIRRFLLAGGKMTDMAAGAANHNPKLAYDREEAGTLYHKKNYVAIPIIDSGRKLIDIYRGTGSEKRNKVPIDLPVVINAGGKGTRLEPFTKVLPKPLIPVGELPIIEHIMHEFQGYNCSEFHIIVNYKRELMKAYFAESDRDYDITWYDEHKPLGTGGGLYLLKNRIDHTFFFTNCDNLLTANYARMLEFHRENGNAVTMVCAYKNFHIPYGVVEMGVNGKLEGMREKPLMSFLTNTGIYIVEPCVLEGIEDDVAIGFPDIIMKEVARGRKAGVFPVSENEWMDMGQLSELEKMRARLYGEESK